MQCRIYDGVFDQKHGKLHAQHLWVKFHVMTGTVTRGIMSSRMTHEGDAPELLRGTRRHFDVHAPGAT